VPIAWPARVAHYRRQILAVLRRAGGLVEVRQILDALPEARGRACERLTQPLPVACSPAFAHAVQGLERDGLVRLRRSHGVVALALGADHVA
jgi:hypothetical protein